jgi:hypothetical protein
MGLPIFLQEFYSIPFVTSNSQIEFWHMPNEFGKSFWEVKKFEPDSLDILEQSNTKFSKIPSLLGDIYGSYVSFCIVKVDVTYIVCMTL